MVATNDLSKSVIAVVILSAVFFVIKISKIHVRVQQMKESTVYYVQGQLFFASVDNFINSIDLSSREKNIILNLTEAHIWDDSAVGAIDKIVIKLSNNKNNVTITGLNTSSKKIVEKLAIYHHTNPQVVVQ